MKKLNEKFLPELFKLLFLEHEIVPICLAHLDYALIPKELGGYKALLRDFSNHYRDTGKAPSLGGLAQKYSDNIAIQEAIDEIDGAQKCDTEYILDQLESYIKDTEFQILSKKVFELYNEGKKEEAMLLNYSESERIINISLRRDSGKFLNVFLDFEKMSEVNSTESKKFSKSSKVKFNIDSLDHISNGGMTRGDISLWIMRSGVGKSTVLRYHGFSAAIEGEKVLHIQLEGGKRPVFNKYTQMWSKSPYAEIMKGLKKENLPPGIIAEYEAYLECKTSIEIYSFDRFGESSVIDVRNLIEEYYKIHKFYPSLIIIDSLDLLKTGENVKIDTDPTYLKFKLQKCAQRLKDIAVEFDCCIITATQSADVPFEYWNDPDKVIDRSHTEGDRTLVKPFSFVFTGNVTAEEIQNNQFRIFFDKVRDYKNLSYISKIKTSYDTGFFYDKEEMAKEEQPQFEPHIKNKKPKTNSL